MLLSKSSFHYSHEFEDVFIRLSLPTTEHPRCKVLLKIVRVQEKSSNNDNVNLVIVLNSFKERYKIHSVKVTKWQSSCEDSRSNCVSTGIMTMFYKIDWKTSIDFTPENEQAATT